MPRQRFRTPRTRWSSSSGRPPATSGCSDGGRSGLWPSEGSVSDAMVPLVAAAGFAWMATDELILARTLGVDVRARRPRPGRQPERLYAPVPRPGRRRQVACAFRDHALSDLIGFHYPGWAADAAADDFVGACRGGRAPTPTAGRGRARRLVILDGENAWEHFEGGGRPFLRALYRRLSDHPELRTVTMAEACADPRQELPGIFPGSWIDANFYIWIGHADDQRALEPAGRGPGGARRAPAPSRRGAAEAREEMLIAEGSDWFWWYGDDHSSDHDPEFDDLFRRHLRNVYRLLGQPVPDELFVSNISGRRRRRQTEPTALLAPTIDGEESSYFEWLGAGPLEVRTVARCDAPERRSKPLLGDVLRLRRRAAVRLRRGSDSHGQPVRRRPGGLADLPRARRPPIPRPADLRTPRRASSPRVIRPRPRGSPRRPRGASVAAGSHPGSRAAARGARRGARRHRDASSWRWTSGKPKSSGTHRIDRFR